MIQIAAQMRVLVAIEAVDGRKGIDSLARLCQEKLAEDPFSGCVFMFRSRSGTSLRLLAEMCRSCPAEWKYWWRTVWLMEGASLWKSFRTFPRSAGMCWRCWARCTDTMPKRVMSD